MDKSTWDKRRMSIGASELAAAMGLSRYETPGEVIAKKIWETDPGSGNRATRIGQILEGPIGEWYAEETGRTIYANAESFEDDVHHMSATPDFIVDGAKRLGECKTSGLASSWGFDPDEWGDTGTDEIPQEYWVQCQGQMSVLGADVVDVPAWIADRDAIYTVERDQEFIEQAREHVRELWSTYVETETLPDNEEFAPRLDLLKRIVHVAGKEITFKGRKDLSLISDWEDAKAGVRSAKKWKSLTEARLRARIGDAQVVMTNGGVLVVHNVTRNNQPQPASVSEFTQVKKYESLEKAQAALERLGG